MEEHKVWLPFPPSVNNAFPHAVVKGKIRRFPSKGYKAWRREAVIRIRSWWKTAPPFAAPVVVKLELTPKNSRPRDADNYAKPVLDALVEARVLTDDSNRYVKAVIPYWLEPAQHVGQDGVVVMIRLADMEAQREALTKNESKALTLLRRRGIRLVGPRHRPTNAMQGLIQKGYARELPGLFDGVPQGYAPND